MSQGAEHIVTSLAAVGRFFGVSPTAISRDWRARGMPGSDGRYDLGEIARWRIEYERAGADHRREGPAESELAARLEPAEVQRAEAEAKLKELKLREAVGELVDRAAVRASVEEAFQRVRARLEQIPQEVGTAVPPENRPDAIADMRHKIGLVLREMEGWSE